MQHRFPDESSFRKTYAPPIYHETETKVRDEIKDDTVGVFIDKNTDKEDRLVGNVVIVLLGDKYSERILLRCFRKVQ